MSQSFTIDVKDKASSALQRKMDACAPHRLNAFIGPRLSKLTQDHFIRLPHNKKGWKPVNFWADAARSTSWMTLPEGVLIRVNKIGVRQRYQGGVIRPVNAKALTIPIAEEAYGKTAADFGDQLQLIVIKGKGSYLAIKPQIKAAKGHRAKRGEAGPSQNERMLFLFKLCASINQDADPNVLPTDDEYSAEAIAGAKEAVK
jgi:hypothetical protein